MIDFYQLDGSDLKLCSVAAKVIPQSGTYYLFTVTDKNGKEATFKVDDVHAKASWKAT